MDADRERLLWIRLERLGVALLIVAALVPRATDLWPALESAGGDRAAAAALAIHAPEVGVRDGAPPALRALARVALADEPRAAAVALQVRALLLHLAAALALFLLLRRTHGLAAGLFALALWASLPVAILHGSLWGPENTGLALGLAAAVVAERWSREGGASRAALAAGLALLGAAVGWTAPLLVAAVLLPAWGSGGRARAAAAFALAPLALAAGLHLGAPAGPDWLPAEGRAPLAALGVGHALVAVLGLGLRAARTLSPAARAALDARAVGDPPRRELAVPLAIAGALAAWLEPGASLVVLAPGVAAAGAALYVQLARPLLALRAGLAPLVVAVGLVAVPGLAGFEHMRDALDGRPPGDPPRPAERLQPDRAP